MKTICLILLEDGPRRYLSNLVVSDSLDAYSPHCYWHLRYISKYIKLYNQSNGRLPQRFCYYCGTLHFCRRSKRRFRIILGDHNRLTAPPDAQVRTVSEIVRHRHYNERNMNCDIALMRLNRPVIFTRNIRPICQPPRGRSDKSFSLPVVITLYHTNVTHLKFYQTRYCS